MAKSFKALYLKNVHFLEATAPARSSYIWKGIIWRKELLDRDLGWRIGDGSLGNIWSNNWLSGSSSFKIFTHAHPEKPL